MAAEAASSERKMVNGGDIMSPLYSPLGISFQQSVDLPGDYHERVRVRVPRRSSECEFGTGSPVWVGLLLP